MPDTTRSQDPLDDGEERLIRASGQRWLASWHPPGPAPAGKPHGSAGLCITPQGQIVLVSANGQRWELPAGRTEPGEDWEQTLRREVREEACAEVVAARLLGFYRGQCVEGRQNGLVLVRAIWRAAVTLDPWQPQFETRHRKLVPPPEALRQFPPDDGHLPAYRRALIEAGLV